MADDGEVDFIEELARNVGPVLSEDAVCTLLLRPFCGRRSRTQASAEADARPRPDTAWPDVAARKVKGVFAPDARTGRLSEADAKEVRDTAKTLLVPIMYTPRDDTKRVERLLEQVKTGRSVALAMLLLPPGVSCSPVLNEALLKRQGVLLQAGLDDVLMNPDLEEIDVLRNMVEVALAGWQICSRRLSHFLAMEPPEVPEAELQKTRAQHARLLWQDGAKIMLPKFPSLDKSLRETQDAVGEYRMVAALKSVSHALMHVTDAEGRNRMMKVINKRDVIQFATLEGIYREFRFLSSILRHPNIVPCLQFLHSSHRLYLVFEFAGDMCLDEVLQDLPGERMPPQGALHCIREMSRGLAYCHSSVVSMRTICPESVFLDRRPGDGKYVCKFVDFSCASFSTPDVFAQTRHGTLPCIPPEVAAGEPYLPQMADCWSLGVVLLETAGGRSSMARTVAFSNDDDPATVAPAIFKYFRGPGSHPSALATVGAVRHTGITELLAMLLQPKPPDRAQMPDFLAHVKHVMDAES